MFPVSQAFSSFVPWYQCLEMCFSSKYFVCFGAGGCWLFQKRVNPVALTLFLAKSNFNWWDSYSKMRFHVSRVSAHCVLIYLFLLKVSDYTPITKLPSFPELSRPTFKCLSPLWPPNKCHGEHNESVSFSYT